MEALQLHDKFTEDIIGTILLRGRDNREDIERAWDEFQKYHSSNNEKYGDIYDFVNSEWAVKMDLEVLNIDFYQP